MSANHGDAGDAHEAGTIEINFHLHPTLWTAGSGSTHPFQAGRGKILRIGLSWSKS